MTSIENAAHELRIALQNYGLIWDGVTLGDDWPDETEKLIAVFMSDAIADALEVQHGR